MNPIRNSSFVKYFFYFLGIPFIPEALNHINEPLILHISDTPSEIYPYLYKIIQQLSPKYIIHTGDLVDDIKLEYLQEQKVNYKKNVQNLFSHLKKMNSFEFYMIPGNHDCPETIQSLWKDVKVLHEGITLQIGNLTIGAAHFFEKLPEEADIYLYGHNLHREEGDRGKYVYLNGIHNIHVISTLTKQIFYIPYPLNTNGLRRMTNRKVGI